MRGLAVLLVLAACSGGPGASGPTTPTGGGGGTRTRAPVDGGTDAPAADTPSLALAGTTCPTPGCVFHAGTARYFSCLASGAGACFHFGAPCSPTDACRYDPSAKGYRGEAGSPCTPAGACAFNPSDGLHHTCENWTSGTCSKWGALCAP